VLSARATNGVIHSFWENPGRAIKSCGKPEKLCGKPGEFAVENFPFQKVLLQVPSNSKVALSPLDSVSQATINVLQTVTWLTFF
jgi:hypothetical protein